MGCGIAFNQAYGSLKAIFTSKIFVLDDIDKFFANAIIKSSKKTSPLGEQISEFSYFCSPLRKNSPK
jgi:hypothetical protein